MPIPRRADSNCFRLSGRTWALSAWAVLELFLMRKAAVRAFVIALVMNVGLTAFHLLATNWREAAGGSGLATVIVSWIVSVGVLLYAKRLSDRGVLT